MKMILGMSRRRGTWCWLCCELEGRESITDVRMRLENEEEMMLMMLLFLILPFEYVLR